MFRVAAVSAVTALVLSVLAGLLGGVSFGVLLVRALVSALLFGAGGSLIVLVAGRFLPGLLEPQAEASPPESNEGGTRPVSQAKSSGGRLNIVVEEDGSEPLDEEGAPHEDENDLVEEVEEQSVDDEEAVMKSIIAAETEDGDSPDGGDTLDQIPDIGGFAGSFVGPAEENAEAGYGPENGRSEDRPRDGRGTGSGNDPVQIAQALRTMLNRDK